MCRQHRKQENKRRETCENNNEDNETLSSLSLSDSYETFHQMLRVFLFRSPRPSTIKQLIEHGSISCNQPLPLTDFGAFND